MRKALGAWLGGPLALVLILTACSLFLPCHAALAEEFLLSITPSPDGTRLAVVEMGTENCSLVILVPSSMEQMQRYILPGWTAEGWYGVSWAPNQSWVALTIVEGSRVDPEGLFIWRMDLPSGKASRLVGGEPLLPQRPRISSKGDALVFRDATRADLLLLHMGETSLRVITKFGDVSRIGFEWSADGSAVWIARGHLGAHNGIWRVPVHGTEPQLLPGSEGRAPMSLKVSPSGTWLAFAEQGGEENNYNDRLYASRLEVWAPLLLSDRGGPFFEWSPKTETLAFTANERLAFWSPGDATPLVTDVQAAYPVWVGPQTVAYLKDGNMDRYKEVWLYHRQEKTTEKLFAPPVFPRPKAAPGAPR